MTSHSTTVPSISEPSLYSSRPDQSPDDSSADSSAVASEDDSADPKHRRLSSRPNLGSRKSSGTMIVSREASQTMVEDDIEEGDVRTMSPRRNSSEVDELGEEARKDMIRQAKELQTSLQAIVDRVEDVKSEHEKLEGGNKFLQSYVQNFSVRMQPTLTVTGTSANSCQHQRSHQHQSQNRKAKAEVRNEFYFDSS